MAASFERAATLLRSRGIEGFLLSYLTFWRNPGQNSKMRRTTDILFSAALIYLLILIISFIIALLELLLTNLHCSPTLLMHILLLST